jgi:hypothetical protein
MNEQEKTFIGVSDRDGKWLSAKWLSDGNLTDISQTSFAEKLEDSFLPCRSETSAACRKVNKTLTSQWEGVAVVGEQTLLLQESTGLLHLFSLSGAYQNHWRLNFYPYLSQLVGGKAKGKSNALGEGLVVLKEGHLLVAKERDPGMIVEFAPIGRSSVLKSSELLEPALAPLNQQGGGLEKAIDLLPVAVWTLPEAFKECDLSELTLHQGEAYWVSQKCRQIHRSRLNEAGTPIEVLQSWNLPKEISNPESLLVLAPGQFLVGDDKKSTKGNFYYLGEKK